MVSPVLAGQKLWVISSTDQPHSFTYVPDLAAAMIRSAQTPSLWNAASRAALGLHPTPLAEAAAATVAWWRAQG